MDMGYVVNKIIVPKIRILETNFEIIFKIYLGRLGFGLSLVTLDSHGFIIYKPVTLLTEARKEGIYQEYFMCISYCICSYSFIDGIARKI